MLNCNNRDFDLIYCINRKREIPTIPATKSNAIHFQFDTLPKAIESVCVYRVVARKELSAGSKIAKRIASPTLAIQ